MEEVATFVLHEVEVVEAAAAVAAVVDAVAAEVGAEVAVGIATGAVPAGAGVTGSGTCDVAGLDDREEHREVTGVTEGEAEASDDGYAVRMETDGDADQDADLWDEDGD